MASSDLEALTDGSVERIAGANRRAGPVGYPRHTACRHRRRAAPHPTGHRHHSRRHRC